MVERGLSFSKSLLACPEHLRGGECDFSREGCHPRALTRFIVFHIPSSKGELFFKNPSNPSVKPDLSMARDIPASTSFRFHAFL